MLNAPIRSGPGVSFVLPANRNRWVILAVGIAVVAAACGGGAETMTTTSDGRSATASTSTVASGTPALFDLEEVVVTADVAYGDERGDGFSPSLLDVYAPPTGGPWPLVMLFHSGSGESTTKTDTAGYARLLAARGAVVFAPNHGGRSAGGSSERDMRYLEDFGVSCATSFALAEAENYGGDPAELVLAGGSGGAIAAAIVAAADDPPGEQYCLVDPELVHPDRLVLWEGDWVLAPWWDTALSSAPDFYSETWVLNSLPSNLDSMWFVMTGPPERTSPGISIDNPYGSGDECGPPGGATCNFLDLRDPTGELREEMGALGFYDDGWLTITESSVLLVERLERKGIPHELMIFKNATHGPMSLATRRIYFDLILTGQHA